MFLFITVLRILYNYNFIVIKNKMIIAIWVRNYKHPPATIYKELFARTKQSIVSNLLYTRGNQVQGIFIRPYRASINTKLNDDAVCSVYLLHTYTYFLRKFSPKLLKLIKEWRIKIWLFFEIIFKVFASSDIPGRNLWSNMV